MKNLKKVTAILFVLFISLNAFAQGPKNNGDREEMKEKMAAVKIGYLTEKLDLTEKEATAFWPVYNQEKAELEGLKKPKPEGQPKKMEDLSDKELQEKINAKFDLQQKRLDIQKSYTDKYINVIGVQKTAKLLKAESEFKKEMLAKIKQNHKPEGSHCQEK